MVDGEEEAADSQGAVEEVAVFGGCFQFAAWGPDAGEAVGGGVDAARRWAGKLGTVAGGGFTGFEAGVDAVL